MEPIILILGKGWVGTYLVNTLESNKIPYKSTTRDGRNNTIKFDFDEKNPNKQLIASLPWAKFVLITFPITNTDSIDLLCSVYSQTHDIESFFMLLGSTSAFIQNGSVSNLGGSVINRHSKLDTTNQRAMTEQYFIEKWSGVVFNLSGLIGLNRHPSLWVDRVAPNKESLSKKGSLHLIHGQDIADSILQYLNSFKSKERWILTDLRSYDWYDLALLYCLNVQGKWVIELMNESNIPSLPRPHSISLDSCDFWNHINLLPKYPLYSIKSPGE